jgi:PelA/Pel-15E family pectate lyase
MLIYQLENGAWSKQLVDKSVVNYELPLNQNLLKKIKETGIQQATIDNNATTREIRHLIQAYGQTNNKAYLRAAERGIAYLLSAQYENGGFPQYYPNKSLYRGQITLNDNAMVNALIILNNTALGTEGFESVRSEYRTLAQSAVEKGIKCLLKLQVEINGVPTIWAAQYDENSLKPDQARKYEPASLSTSESVNVVRFLMIQKPSYEIKNAIEAAIKWFETHDIEGYRYERTQNKQTGEYVRRLVPDSSSVIWARFYDLNNNKPIFGDRDNSVTYDYEDLSLERKNGYAWFGNWAEKLIQKDYPKWINKTTNK